MTIDNQDTGRNETCPCGSGRKYKRCCGAAGRTPAMRPEADDIGTNKAIAYMGRLGRLRRDFCVSYIENKKMNLAATREAQINRATEKGGTITCKSGCYFCCGAYVEAWLQECEAIVFHLYGHPDLMADFLGRYPGWRGRVRAGGDLFKQCRGAAHGGGNGGQGDERPRSEYYRQQIGCPFLDGAGACSIYEVRPYSCAALFALTPNDCCRPDSAIPAEAYRAFSMAAAGDNAYFVKLPTPVISFMPIAVFELITKGVRFLSSGRIPGLENMARDFYGDPEVTAWLNSRGLTAKL